ncbi:hypothetical protein V2G26_001043 [Clonostachys chloroleuca]
MPRGSGRGGHGHSARRLVDLTGILSVAERNDLSTLVIAITERMHTDISATFDSPVVTPIDAGNGHHNWLTLPLLCHKEGKKDISSVNSKPKHPKKRGKTYDKVHSTIEREEKEAMTPQLGELKKEALTFFRKWQSLILQRMKDVAVTEPKAPHPGGRGRGRGFRGDDSFRGRGGRGGKAGRGGLTLATGPPRLPSAHIDLELSKQYPPIPNTLWSLPIDRRRLFFHIVFLITLSLQEYTANSFLLLANLTSCLNLPFIFFQTEEIKLARGLAHAALETSAEALLALKLEETKSSRRFKGYGNTSANPTLATGLESIGLGTSSGGFGLTGAIAASLLGAMADNARMQNAVFGINPSKPLGKLLETFSRDIQDVGFIPVHPKPFTEYADAREVLAEDRRLRVVIALNGWVIEDEDLVKPWICLGQQTETYTLRWDMATLLNLGNSLETVILSSAWGVSKKEVKTRTIFKCLLESDWPGSLLKVSKIIDNPWNVGLVRAEKAGGMLADAIMRHKFQGDRPVSLVGYSLGARAIYCCLMVLAERRHFGGIESVVLMGAPIPSESRVWLTLKSVVAGRLINVYSEHDFLLGFLCRFSNTDFGIAGLQEIQGATGVENYNAGDLTRGHLGYRSAAGRILRDVKWEQLSKNGAHGGKPAGHKGRR